MTYPRDWSLITGIVGGGGGGCKPVQGQVKFYPCRKGGGKSHAEGGGAQNVLDSFKVRAQRNSNFYFY